jgi:hypothetical protein
MIIGHSGRVSALSIDFARLWSITIAPISVSRRLKAQFSVASHVHVCDPYRTKADKPRCNAFVKVT